MWGRDGMHACMHDLTDLGGWMEFMGYVFVWAGEGEKRKMK